MTSHPTSWRFCVAPMMDCTDRHYRFFARLLSRKALLYTEMIVAAALVHGDASPKNVLAAPAATIRWS